VVASLYLSFTDFDLLRDPRWIGLDNYVRIRHQRSEICPPRCASRSSM
jgi:ABC-type sugar transport system permease subunit